MQISIRQHSFTIRSPFSEGTVITKAEAQALNGLRAENIRNNMAKLAAGVFEGLPAGGVLPVEIQAELQRQVTEYDLGYQFGLKPEPRGKNPIEAEALVVATERVEAGMRRSGVALSRVEYEAELVHQLASQEVQAEARRRVVVANQAAARALAELL